MIKTDEFKPMLELMLISKEWEIEVGAKGEFSLKVKGTPETVKAGLVKVDDEAEIEKIAQAVTKKLQRDAVKNFLNYGRTL